ncbi:BREX-1 system adenine-specific DNA-methyltransferase PglX [Clostridium nigeriense]|uniref:BREX-1 system adenine-specific DNA-methyltransferase PglX n=1 Tax=Clostridium nigeriense TaxID=1805470 RepID=UPI0008374161|nr:BREX-1 system adenine-specific DNA-methyltransferase PglX [Clostridium nigeriense]
MDKNKIKSFAIWARRNLIAQVSQKANRIGIFEDKIEEAIVVQGGFKLESKDEIFALPKSDRDALVNQVKEKGFEQVMEEVAYTWFNRFMGLRYMEVNDYLPSGIRILSSEIEEKKEPDVLTKISEVIDELDLNTKANEIYDLLDTGDTLDREKAYRIILVKQCNELGKIIPQMFEKISDYTELLLPDNLLEDGSVIRKMVEDIEEEDWKEEVEIIGWMYQYYNTENNELVYDGTMQRNKIPKELLPAATQIFTPDWVVEYMIENSLGNLIYSNSEKGEKITSKWDYFIKQEKEESKKLINIEEIKIIDPAMGSGHILVCAFDLLMEVYEAYGYSERQATKLILSNNLYGLDIDDRASQIANFAVIMRARKYNRRILREKIETKLYSIKESNKIDESLIDFVSNKNEHIRSDIEYLINIYQDAKEYGSIINLKNIDFDNLNNTIKSIINNPDLDLISLDKVNQVKMLLVPLVNQAIAMTNKYDIVVTNPPYLNSSRMSEKLSRYVNDNYPQSKSDFSMIFYEKAIKDLCKANGYISFITTTSWMYLKSFENIRKYIIENLEFESLVDFGTELFEGKVGHNPIVAWVNKNCKPSKKMSAIKLSDFCFSRKDEKKVEFFNEKNRYITDQKEYRKIPGMPIAYWISKNITDIFDKSKMLEEIANPKQGLATGENDRFLRRWNEVEIDKIVFNAKNSIEFINSKCKWAPYNKGGEYRKWFGNNEYIVMWENDGYEIKNFKNDKGKLRSRPQNVQFYFNKCLTWSKVTSGGFSVRFIPDGFIFDVAGCSIFTETNYIKNLLGFLNSNTNILMLSSMSKTLNFEVGQICNLPIKDIFNNYRIGDLVDRCINLSKNDWNNFENSWEFSIHPLLEGLDKGKSYKLDDIFRNWSIQCNANFEELKNNEEELNKIFINIYGLQTELCEKVNEKEITIRKAERERDIKSFISYFVGCMFGRYSIDVEGLIYAGGYWREKWLLSSEQHEDEKVTTTKVRKVEKDQVGNIISDSWINSRFSPDIDNIIPITEDEYFVDDIVSRFIDFVRVVYGNDTLEENLDFIVDSIGRKSSETARQAIRRYFIKDFYKDHLKVYQKRPIYWMFDSGKNDGFKCLIYMHRYNDQTVAKVRTDYLHTLQRKYEAEINRLQLIVDSEEYTAKDRTAAKKKIDRITKQIEECKEYDQVVAHLANEKIFIDLDDGVKVNYAKFQDIKVINSKDKEVKLNLLAKI